MTGINSIIFYSNTILANLGWSPSFITGIVGIITWATTWIGIVWLNYAGRRTIMLWCHFGMAVVLILCGIFQLKDMNYPTIAMVFLFITIFEASSGPITWLYMPEIMQDKALSIATMLNFVINFVIGISIPHIVDAIGNDNIGYIFIVFGALVTVGYFFLWACMKETKGKTQQEIDMLFSKLQ